MGAPNTAIMSKIALRYALMALTITAAVSYAPAGPDNLTAEEAAAVQTNLDRFLSLFDSLAGAPGNNKELCQSWVADTFMQVHPKFTHPPPIGPVHGLTACSAFATRCETSPRCRRCVRTGHTHGWRRLRTTRSWTCCCPVCT